jgi:hypothetical protein
MKIFRNYTFTVWQMAVIKLAVAAVGMILGAFFATFVLDTLWLFIAIWVIAAGYILWITYKPGTPTDR